MAFGLILLMSYLATSPHWQPFDHWIHSYQSITNLAYYPVIWSLDCMWKHDDNNAQWDKLFVDLIARMFMCSPSRISWTLKKVKTYKNLSISKTWEYPFCVRAIFLKMILCVSYISKTCAFVLLSLFSRSFSSYFWIATDLVLEFLNISILISINKDNW